MSRFLRAIREAAAKQPRGPLLPTAVSTREERLRLCRPAESWVVSAGTGEAVGIRVLDRTVFGAPLNAEVVHRNVVYERALARTGQYKTKRRGEINATTRKPFAQKGTGKARQGSLVGPHQRGGGKAHGPVLRSFAIGLPRKMRDLGLRVALSAKYRQDELVLVEGLVGAVEQGKTREVRDIVARLGVDRPLLVTATAEPADRLRRGAQNLFGVATCVAADISVYKLLRAHSLVLTPAAVAEITERLSVLPREAPA